MEYRFETLSGENISDLKIIYKAVFGNDYSVDDIMRKFDTDYLGVKYFGHIAYFDNKPIAFHGAIPVQMRYNGELELAAQYGDAMTLKNHTGKGLFTKLGEMTDQQLQNAGIRFVWGFPNQNSEYGYLNNLHWSYVERMKGFKIRTSNFPMEKIARKTKLTSNLYQKKVESVFGEFKVNAVLNGSVFLNSDVASTNRNKDYYSYKSFTDNFMIEIAETQFWIKIKNGLLIGDVAVSSVEKFDKALNQLKQLASENGIDSIIFQASPSTQLAEIMERRADEKFDSWIVGFKDFSSGFPLEKLKFTFGDLDTF
jgi:hypothetical protein